MDASKIAELIEKGCSLLYAHDRDLIDQQTNERTICGRLVALLQALFPEWKVDGEYNRQGDAGEPKRIQGELILPDIIIHSRGNVLGPNLVAIEAKGHWNEAPREEDEIKLRRLRAEFQYQFLFRLEFGRSSFSLIPVDPPSPEATSIS